MIDLGTAAAPLKLDVYAAPGHENALVMLHDKVSGYLFATDYFGCTRMGTADNVGISGAKMDWQLSNVMQLQAAMKRDGGKLTKLFTGHDEMMLPGEHVDMFQQLLQNIVDMQEAACQPTIRSSDAPRARNAVIGNMFTDLYDWAAINTGGTFGTTPYTYLSAPNPAYSTPATIDFTQPNAHLKYAVLDPPAPPPPKLPPPKPPKLLSDEPPPKPLPPEKSFHEPPCLLLIISPSSKPPRKPPVVPPMPW